MADRQHFGHVKFLTQGGGFFSCYFFTLSMVMECHQRNLKPYIDWRRTSFVENYNPYFDPIPVNPENPWDWWCEQEQPTDSDVMEEVEYSIKNFSLETKLWQREDMPYARMIADTYIRIRPYIIEKVDKYYDEFMKGKIVLGVMARGCEFDVYHPQFGKHVVESWISAINDIMQTHPEISSVFLVTEDSNYIPPICNSFPNTTYMRGIFRRTKESMSYMINTPLWPSMVHPREHHCKLLGEECLTQVLLLGRCDYLLVKQCGTSAGAILYATDNLKDVFYLS